MAGKALEIPKYLSVWTAYYSGLNTNQLQLELENITNLIRTKNTMHVCNHNTAIQQETLCYVCQLLNAEMAFIQNKLEIS